VLCAAIVFANGNSANRVLGQLDFTHQTPNLVDAKGLFNPDSVAIDTSSSPNRVYVSDRDNNRVLGWQDAATFANGAAADLVIGQPNFLSSGCGPVSASSLCDPDGIAVDGLGNLYVVDSSRSRVLEYTNPFEACNNTFPCVGRPANLVFGQGGSFNSAGCDFDTIGVYPPAASAVDLCAPSKVAVDHLGNVFVADSGNNRVLEYDTPLTTDVTADKDFGQNGDLTKSDCNLGGSPVANSLCDPEGVAVDGADNLYVADTGNSRVLEFNAALTSDGNANLVFGQGGSFISGACNFDANLISPASSADDLCSPSAVGVDSAGNVYVADGGNNRALEYLNPLAPGGGTPGAPGSAGDVTADAVFGQGGSYASNSCDFDVAIPGSQLDGSTSNDLCTPNGVAIDSAGNLYVADTDNNRVLEYNAPPFSNTTAARVLGQADFTHQEQNLTDAKGLFDPASVAIDINATPNHVYISDSMNNRVLGWNDASSFSNGAPADLVIGQPDFLSYFCDGASGSTVSASSLCDPEGIAVDGSGNLYVADSLNNRMLEFATPFTACANTFPCVGGAASVVLGQGMSFSTGTANSGGISASSLDGPLGVAVDGSGNAYVADAGNNRVLEYNAPVMTGAAASLVFGQGGSFTSHACNFDTGSPPLHPASAIDLCDPSGVAIDASGNVYIADFSNSRVLEYNTPLSQHNSSPTANEVFGQGGSFSSDRCNLGGIGTGALCFPRSVILDESGDLYISDSVNDRVLEYNTPLSNATADQVFGRCGSFAASACAGVSANSLIDPTGVATDKSGNLYVTDRGDNRVLEYDRPLTTATPTPTATATTTPTATATATPTPVPASLKVSPKNLRFASPMGVTSKARKVKLVAAANPQNLPILIMGAVATPPFSIDAALSTCHVGMELPAKSDCFFFLTYTASALGKQPGTFTITDDSQAGNAAIVNLSGVGKPVRK
jgi:sugar lactone lactonase YvrE